MNYFKKIKKLPKHYCFCTLKVKFRKLFRIWKFMIPYCNQQIKFRETVNL